MPLRTHSAEEFTAALKRFEFAVRDHAHTQQLIGNELPARHPRIDAINTELEVSRNALLEMVTVKGEPTDER